MSIIEWTESFSVKVEELDSQHKILIERINLLDEAMKNNRGREVQKFIIDGMVSYAMVHFATEEKYMKQFNYSGYSTHKEEHRRFEAKALDLKKRVAKAGFVLSFEILTFLRDWLQNHILKTDQEYVAFFNQNGLH